MFNADDAKEKPRPTHIAFVDPNVDPYKSRPVTPLDPKKDIGWAMRATTSGTNGAVKKSLDYRKSAKRRA